jgi:hypothetical protein
MSNMQSGGDAKIPSSQTSGVGLRLKCAWCQRWLRGGDTKLPISHGICESCMAIMLKKGA